MSKNRREEFIYTISGKLYDFDFHKKEKYTYKYLKENCNYKKYNEDLNDNQEYHFFNCVISNLNNKTKEIEKDISIKIKNKLYSQSEFNNVNIQVDLNFKVGSIEWGGMISYIYDIVQVTANVGGAIAFIQFIKDTVNSTISEYISNEVYSKNSDYYLKETYANIHTEIVLIKQNTLNAIEHNNTSKSSLFTTDKILIFITLLNVIIFFGGTISSTVTVNSIKQQYKESSQIINQAKDKYYQAENSLKILNNKLELSKNQIDNLIIQELKNYDTNLNNKFEPKIKQIKDDLNKYQVTTSKLELENKKLQDRIKSLVSINIKSKKLYEESLKYSKQIKIINEQLSLEKNSIFIDFIQKLWNNGDLFTKAILILLFLYITAPIFIIYSYILNPTYLWIKRKFH